MNTPELKRLMQIGIIVRNIDEAVANYEAIGIGPWEISVMDNSVPPFDDLKIDGRELTEKGPIIKSNAYYLWTGTGTYRTDRRLKL